MACESCIAFVKDALELIEIEPIKVVLGEIEIKKDFSEDERSQFVVKIKEAGLELLESKKGVLIEKIKQTMVDYIYHSDEGKLVNFSDFICEKLNHSYGYLANFFSDVQATTIEQYLIAMKIERVKELIILEDTTLKEISYKLNYSSVGHLSAQFKKVTGLTPTHFKSLKERRRLTIQSL